MKKGYPQNIYQYVLCIILVSILSIILIGSYLYYFCYNSIYSEFRSTNKQCVISVAEKHERDLEMVENVRTQIFLADDATRFLLRKNPEKGIALKKLLKGYTVTSTFYNVIFYHYKKDDRLYNYSTSIAMDTFLYREPFLGNTSAEEMRDILEGKGDFFQIIPEQYVSGEFLQSYVGSDSATIIAQVVDVEKDEILLFFVPSAYYNHLLSNEIFDNDLSFLYMDNQMIVSRGDKELFQEELTDYLIDSNIEALLNEKEIMQQEITLREGKYLLTITKGNSGICYATIQNKQKFYDKIWSDQIIIAIIVIVSIIIAVVGISFLSKFLKQKVKRINELLDEKEVYDLTCIEKGVQALIKDKEDDEKNNLSIRKMQFIRSLINGEFKDKENALTEAGKVQLNIDYNGYIVVLLRQEDVNDEGDVYKFFLSMIEEKTGLGGYGIRLVGKNQILFVLFGNSSDILDEYLQRILKMEMNLERKFVISVSGYHTDITNTSKAYLEADTAFEYSVIMVGNQILRFQDIIQDNNIYFIPDNYFQKIKKTIYNRDRKAIDLLVNEIYNEIKDKKISLYSIRVFYNKILHMFQAEWKEELYGSEVFYDVFFLAQCMDLEDFCNLLKDMCNLLIDKCSDVKNEYSDSVQRAITYMQEYYDDPNLTISILASHMNVSTTSLSISFKNEMMIGPSEYLAGLRIKKAKELLCNTNMLVKEISLKVGYYDEDSFARRFKRDTGLTPRQYREKYVTSGEL